MKNATPAERKLGFQIHALCFVVALPVLAAVDFWTGPPWWMQWVLLGWSIGLFSHWLFGIRLARDAARSDAG